MAKQEGDLLSMKLCVLLRAGRACPIWVSIRCRKADVGVAPNIRGAISASIAGGVLCYDATAESHKTLLCFMHEKRSGKAISDIGERALTTIGALASNVQEPAHS